MTETPTPEVRPGEHDETRAVTASMRSDRCADCGAPLVDTEGGERGCILCGTTHSTRTTTYEVL